MIRSTAYIFYNKARTKIKKILQAQYAILEKATKSSLKNIASSLYAEDIISESMMYSPSYDELIQDFEAHFPFFNDILELKQKCQAFLHCIFREGGPAAKAAETLDSEWKEVFGIESLLPITASTAMSPPISTNSASAEQDMLDLSTALPSGSTQLGKMSIS